MRKGDKDVELRPEWMAVFRHPLWIKAGTVNVVSMMLVVVAVVCGAFAVNFGSLDASDLIGAAAANFVARLLWWSAAGFAVAAFLLRMWVERFRRMARRAVLCELGQTTSV